jgi:hypothetical protein
LLFWLSNINRVCTKKSSEFGSNLFGDIFFTFSLENQKADNKLIGWKAVSFLNIQNAII